MKTKKVNFIFDDAITNYSMNKKRTVQRMKLSPMWSPEEKSTTILLLRQDSLSKLFNEYNNGNPI